jgi:putative Holliday junction resolvase
MRILAVDFGFRRIGIAMGESELGIGSPRKALDASGSLKKDAEAISSVARAEEASLVVVGLPIEPTGEEGRMARICRQLGGHIETLGTPVAFIDESLSSREADRNLMDAGLKASQRRKKVDGEAAMTIMERFWNEQATT